MPDDNIARHCMNYFITSSAKFSCYKCLQFVIVICEHKKVKNTLQMP